jgi:hypothetical protein
MENEKGVSPNIIVSVLYHALQGSATCSTYTEDAERSGDKELAQFFREVQDHYDKIATRAKQILKQKLS